MINRGFLLLFACLPLCGAETAATLSTQLRQMSLDAGTCYRVRDLVIEREDARIYLTDGHLIFGVPIGGKRVVAVYSGNETGDDAEVLLRPPDRGERTALAKAIGAPTLNEHFHTAVFVFTDGSGERLLSEIRAGEPKPAPEMGALLAGTVTEVVRNFCLSFQVRLIFDLLTRENARGMFYAGISGKKLGSFDVLFDPTLAEQFVLGEVGGRSGGSFKIWTSFQSRRRRQLNVAPMEDAVCENYRIDSTLEPDLNLQVTTKATVRARRRVNGAMMFELAPQMELTSASLDGKPVEIFRRESMRDNLLGGRTNEPFLVVLPEPLEPGSAHEIEFHNSGRIVKEAGNKVFFVAARLNWYPAHSQHFTTFDLTFRVPRELRAVSTGELIEERVDGDWRFTRRRTTAPVRLAGFNVGAYESISTTRAGFQVQVFANRTLEPALQSRSEPVVIMPPGLNPLGGRRTGDVFAVPTKTAPNPTGRLVALANEIGSTLEWMSSVFGPPPLKTLTVAPIPGNFGQGFPGLLYLSTIAFLNEKERPASVQTLVQQTFYSEILAAHETAHQWWGNLVTSESYHDDWLLEALANYSALMALERKKGTRALEISLEETVRGLKEPLADDKNSTIESVGPVTWGARLHTETGNDPWRAIVYDKGSWIIHMLRRRMGDAQFLSMLGEIRKRYAYRPLTTEYFREIAAEYSPKGLPDPKLENFFDNWIYATGLPTLEFSSSVKGKAPSVTLNLTLKQSGVNEDFGIDLPVEIRLPGQAKPLVKWIRSSSEPVTLSVALKAVPTKVELAPGAGVLAVRK